MTILKEIGEVFLLLGMIIATVWSGLKFNRVLQRQTAVERLVTDMKSAMDSHHLDNSKHLVEGREDTILELIKETIKEGINTLGARLDKIDARCEKRQETCSDHFARVENRIAAQSRKTNGD